MAERNFNYLQCGVLVALGLLISVPAEAAVIGGTTDRLVRGEELETDLAIDILDPAPSLVANNAIESRGVNAFDEKQGVTLETDIELYSVFDSSIDPTNQELNNPVAPPDVVVPAGTEVNSHFIFTDPVPVKSTSWSGQISFAEPILGIIPFSRPDYEFGLIDTNDLFGLADTEYQLGGRILDGGQDEVTFEGSDLFFDFTTVLGMDPVRVITMAETETEVEAIPEPSTILGTGVVSALGLFIRRRRQRQ